MNPIRHFSSRIALSLLALAPVASFADTNLVANSSFESVPFAMSGYDGSYCYEGSPVYTCGAAMPDWSGAFPTMSSHSGAWTASPNMSADQFQIGLQNNSFISQTVQLAAPGRYTLTWSDAGRSGYGNENYQVDLGSATLASASTLAGQGWSTHSITFNALGGTQVLQFQGLNTNGDSTAFIDNVTLTAAVPEPSTWALMLGGLAVAGVVRRRRS